MLLTSKQQAKFGENLTSHAGRLRELRKLILFTYVYFILFLFVFCRISGSFRSTWVLCSMSCLTFRSSSQHNTLLSSFI